MPLLNLQIGLLVGGLVTLVTVVSATGALIVRPGLRGPMEHVTALLTGAIGLLWATLPTSPLHSIIPFSVWDPAEVAATTGGTFEALLASSPALDLPLVGESPYIPIAWTGVVLGLLATIALMRYRGTELVERFGA